jgi:hypothetical protein
MKIINKFFNLNTGYFIQEITYPYEGKLYIGYMICKGYVIFCIPGYDVIKYCCDKESLIFNIKELNLDLIIPE